MADATPDLDAIVAASTPTVIPAVPEKVLDKWIIKHLAFNGDGIRQPLSGMAMLVKGHKAADGTWTIDDGVSANVNIRDIWKKAETDPEIASVIASLTALVIRLGREAGSL